MIIENSFVVQVAPERALDVLTDVPQIAECIPGVSLTETLGEGAYAGTAAVRLGPVALSFGGKARIVEINREAGTAKVEASGADQKGRGQASADVDFTLRPADGGTRVDVCSDITLSGQIAQYGRASGLINEVANQIISQFVQNLETKLGAADHAGQPAGDTDTDASDQQSAGPSEISGFRVLFAALKAIIVRLFSGKGRR